MFEKFWTPSDSACRLGHHGHVGGGIHPLRLSHTQNIQRRILQKLNKYAIKQLSPLGTRYGNESDILTLGRERDGRNRNEFRSLEHTCIFAHISSL